MKKTKIVELWGGPSAGKSTLAAELFSQAKRMHVHCELVKEAAKDRAWQKRTIQPIEQIQICAEQMKREADYYGAVDYIFTDSSIFLCSYYQRKYCGSDYLLPMLRQYNTWECSNFARYALLIDRSADAPYDALGRNETHEQALEIDRELVGFMEEVGIPIIRAPNNITWADVKARLDMEEGY